MVLMAAILLTPARITPRLVALAALMAAVAEVVTHLQVTAVCITAELVALVLYASFIRSQGQLARTHQQIQETFNA